MKPFFLYECLLTFNFCLVLSVDSQPPTIVEAKGWIVNQEGQIELVANNTFSRGRFSDATIDCSSLSKNANTSYI